MDEAKALAERFRGVANRAQFARDYAVPGGQAMIYQHTRGLKPISLKAAEAYARGFGCSIAEISERCARLVEHAQQIGARPSALRQATAAYKVPGKIAHLPASFEDWAEDLVQLARKLDEEARRDLIGMARVLIARPAKTKKKKVA